MVRFFCSGVSCSIIRAAMIAFAILLTLSTLSKQATAAPSYPASSSTPSSQSASSAPVPSNSVAPAASPTSRTFTLMTYNIHAGIPMGKNMGNYKSEEKDLTNLAAVIREQRPDVVALQESDCEYGALLPVAKRRSSALNQPRLLSAMTGLYYAFGSTVDDHVYPSDNAEYLEWGAADRWRNNVAKHGEFGNTLLFNLPLVAPPTNHPLPRGENQERRACLRIELLASKEFTGTPRIIVYAAHLQHDNADSRVEQIKAILDMIARERPDSPVFLLGDFNYEAPDAPSSARVPLERNVYGLCLAAGLHDLYGDYERARGRQPEPTFPEDHPNRRIDYIFSNREVDILEARVIESAASDHRAVVVKIRLP